MRDSKVYRFLSGLNQIKWNVAYKGVLVGLVCGLLVSFYRLGIEFGTEKAVELYEWLRLHPGWIPLWCVAAVCAGLFLWRLIRFEPYAKGSGIPQVEGIVLLGMKIRWHSVLLVRFLAGILSSFFGVSLGREGPSIQIGAAGSQAISGLLSKNKLEKNYLITAGASAGLAAAFNAPISGIVFALEEVHRSFSRNILIAATTAALTADVVSKYFYGLKPVLMFGEISQLPLRYYVLLLLLGIFCGVMGVVSSKGLLFFSALYERIPQWTRPVLALLLAVPCGLFLPGILGGGQNIVSLSETPGAGASLMALMLVFKLLFTWTSFGSGLPGGIFMPLLSIGAMTGNLFAQGAGLFGVSDVYLPAFCVCAMAGVLSGSVKAPVTSILLMAEMTGSLVHLMPVAAVAFIALLTSDLLKTEPIYEELLHKLAGADKKVVKKQRRRTFIEIPVELGSIAAGSQIKTVDWPKGALIVSILRGETELVPNGDTQILPGDYLIVLSTERNFGEMNKALNQICRAV